MDGIVCYCNNVSKKTLLDCIKNGAKTLQQIGELTKAGIGKNCSELNPTGKCCIPEIQTLLENKTPDTKSCCCCK